MKAVINVGGTRFLPSHLVFEQLISQGWTCTTYDAEYKELIKPFAKIIMHDEEFEKEFGFRYSFTVSFSNSLDLRTNVQFIKIIEELGEFANSTYTTFNIVDVPSEKKWSIIYVRQINEQVHEEILLVAD